MNHRIASLIFLALTSTCLHALPPGFVYLQDVAPEIIEDIRYAGSGNFIGKPVPGYQSGRCILTIAAARHLADVQKEAMKKGYRVKVYDCYRPTRAVNAFYQWSQNPNDTRMKRYYYPREEKKTLFAKGYIARHSGHSRGSTLDLTLVKLSPENSVSDKTRTTSIRCFGKTTKYIDDGTINTGTRFDCLDKSAHVFYPDLSEQQHKNRLFLRRLMIQNGFTPYNKEWWHFTLSQEPYPHSYFNFPVQ
ncbi:M15 family metallopeptidase [Legionella spiritensis]|uniref:D-alanyl-D-alanine dipeptidase n=1 Tax=Legionella spiritensis TaxID=452 RepID=A0A0W0Z8C2_LEGSP|nr:M15 family metallopeptidase [Legionella spiritensis]KTD65336.1 D-alanyl-D-alanine dipeptidase [Legionella spiritensis]SNV47416.1 D-alanyl-D-alanine dipeptidase [Legionella spiritensis]